MARIATKFSAKSKLKYPFLIFLIFSLFLSGTLKQSFSELYIREGKLIVKFKPNSELLKSWLNAKRISSISDFIILLGNHTTKPFISDATLTFLSNRLLQSSFMPNFSPVANLQRICVISFSKKISPLYAARKISSFPDVEYAEPMPLHTLLEIPNDPKFSLQYYLKNIKANDAWDVVDTNKTVLVGIVDTGVEYTHDDLKDNIYVNPGEDGLDKNGNDKRTNGIDDDNDGYIDDWHGWDFVSSTDSSGQDNDPKPGHKHGTHLAGTVGAVIDNKIGIAGVAKKVKLLPVKIGADDPNSTSTENSYEGVLYAALMKCDVINCSWGTPTRAESEQEVINTVVGLGSVVVAAAGNNGQHITFFPAGYRGVMSVGAVGEDDKKAYFSNYDNTVDVTAPGEGIYATVSGNWYDFMDGTSMASPVTAGVAALIKEQFPQYTNTQVIEQVKATTDNIDSLNTTYIGLLGTGRVNALKAITTKDAKSVILKNYTLIDENKNGLFEAGEKVTVQTTFQNVLAPVSGVSILLKSGSTYKPEILTSSQYLGNFSTLEEKSASQPFEFIVPNDVPSNYIIGLSFDISDTSGLMKTEQISFVANPSYRNFDKNNITVTVNSAGSLGYNDYPNNLQGLGMLYKGSANILFEGALCIGVSSNKVSNVARNGLQTERDYSFNSTENISPEMVDSIKCYTGKTKFKDSNQDDEAGVSVTHLLYQFTGEPNKDYIISSYNVVNNSQTDFDPLFVGLFFDWDIGPSGSYNIADFDFDNGFGYVKNVKDSKLPLVGVKLLSSQKLNYFAIDNDGGGGNNPGIYSSFQHSKKWFMMSSGMYRTKSNVTDVSQMISAGPIRLKKGDTTRVSFAIFAGNDYSTLVNASKQSKLLSDSLKISDAYLKPLPPDDRIVSAFPNPILGSELMTIEFAITENTRASMDIFDVTGKLAFTVFPNDFYGRGLYYSQISLDNLSTGKYLLRLTTKNGINVYPIVITR